MKARVPPNIEETLAPGDSNWSPPICWSLKVEQIDKLEKQPDHHHVQMKFYALVALHKFKVLYTGTILKPSAKWMGKNKCVPKSTKENKSTDVAINHGETSSGCFWETNLCLLQY